MDLASAFRQTLGELYTCSSLETSALEDRTLVIQPSPTDPPRPSVPITVLQTYIPFRARLRWNLPVLKAPEAVVWKQRGSESPGSLQPWFPGTNTGQLPLPTASHT